MLRLDIGTPIAHRSKKLWGRGTHYIMLETPTFSSPETSWHVTKEEATEEYPPPPPSCFPGQHPTDTEGVKDRPLDQGLDIQHSQLLAAESMSLRGPAVVEERWLVVYSVRLLGLPSFILLASPLLRYPYSDASVSCIAIGRGLLLKALLKQCNVLNACNDFEFFPVDCVCTRNAVVAYAAKCGELAGLATVHRNAVRMPQIDKHFYFIEPFYQWQHTVHITQHTHRLQKFKTYELRRAAGDIPYENIPVEFIKIVHKFKNNPDIYGVPCCILKQVIDTVAPIVTEVVNRCLSQGTFPNTLKITRTVPIFKKGNPDDLMNYRPISMTLILAKIMETIMKFQLMQYGFRNGKNTTTALLALVDKITDAFENRETVLLMLCGLTKAFDCVSHEILLDKLVCYGIAGIIFNTFKSYLQHRKQTRLSHASFQRQLVTSINLDDSVRMVRSDRTGMWVLSVLSIVADHVDYGPADVVADKGFPLWEDCLPGDNLHTSPRHLDVTRPSWSSRVGVVRDMV
ncbi:hypothetical protein PR048_018284 [Dryococelus australis]|uniref:Reverse transcriptase domain-containing protein n=1 Tax=Dryococelus australis TaxID=614101 RepID=A0ABQ9HCJ8_9NEOP|nr:hypothetical protein PR048_018284 [Dryococelus australis]